MANSNNRQVVPEAKAALNQMKLEIANELGISESMLSRWMNGKTIIPEDKIELLSEYIDKNSKEMYEFWKEKME